MGSLSRMYNPLFHPFLFLYQLMQWCLDKALSPTPPDPTARLHRPKVAVIGAGITGVTAAAHCIGHGFDVVVFEAGPKSNLGGIWSKVNNTSRLQIHSLMYRFHPSVKWEQGYPDRQQILSQLEQLWERYGLDSRTRFETPVEKVYQDERGRWIVNNTSNGRFEGIIAAVGTCGEPKMPPLEGIETFKGPVYHSSQLSGKDGHGKKIVVVGGSASAVEALEWAAAENAEKTYILSRSDKWIIPRNAVVDMLLSLNIRGQQTIFSWIPEGLLRRFFYRDLEDMAPAKKGIFTDTPMVNSDVLDKVREGKADWVRGDVQSFTPEGVIVNRRGRGVPENGPGKTEVIPADIVVMATGYKRPSLAFLPDDCFEPPYDPPNWYLQTFPPTHPSISAINCTYVNAIGTAGNWHIGIYTRILLMFLVDPLTRPRPFWMRTWIDFTRLLKKGSPTAAFDFFTYLELLWWFVFCVAINPFRWKWALFVFFGLGFALPKYIVDAESSLKNGESKHEAHGRDVGRSF
ncbi:FAD/NAD(P)-binding domain-containing protein [Sodiomyces alkalinus F11]|uniref:FAD/NAD(P)-binding domain-containing protein n=1 Tax=Sodiomyces alkalinus (strain CBS 110278 / VKM F-3762 / F11) TaxID=1314773 RepID=A0A3N2Q858_SODAK|nr:FAD/NAD(P)-binding domain-containing protein [Sodiomyces alkalinus F11]ROT42930.1 FAD/NAD(P)-binding domain-containing protein [Sodiomyces alkalinus F11]